MIIFEHVPHPHLEHRQPMRPPRVADERVGINGKIGLLITTVVGTMWAAYIFTLIALVSAPSAFESHDKLTIVAWIAQTFLQLVLLPVIIVGQNIQAGASDKRAVQTYQDAESILHECMELQRHLKAQDDVLERIIAEQGRLGGTPGTGPTTATS